MGLFRSQPANWVLVWLASPGLGFLLGRAAASIITSGDVEYSESIEQSASMSGEIARDLPLEVKSDELDLVQEDQKDETLILAEAVSQLSSEYLESEFGRLVAEKKIDYLKLNFVLHEWASRAPDAVPETILKPEYLSEINLTSTVLMEVWSKQDPLRAYEVYRDHLPHGKVYGAAECAFYALASVDPEAAFRELSAYDNYRNQDHNRRDGIKEALVRHYALPEALKMIDEFSVDNSPSLRAGVIGPWISSNFDSTAKTLWQMDQQAEVASSVIGKNTRSLISGGLTYDPDRTLAWALRRDRTDGTDTLTRYALRHLAISMKKPDAARDWIERETTSRERARYLDILEGEEDQ